MMRSDLHMHSIYSDGELKPVELIHECLDKNVDVVALTDHDTIMGVNEYIEAAKDTKLRIIPGVELSTFYNGEPIHVLGYFKSLDSISAEFKEYLTLMQQRRRDRMEKMVGEVNKIFGFDIKFEDILKEHPYMIERPHLANEIKKITGETRKDIFAKYIGDSSPAYIPTTKLSFEEGVKLIKDAGGLAILAHPYTYSKCNPMDLIKMGVDGVEVFYYPTSIKKYKKYRKYCKKNNLVMTGGSDFHRGYDDYKHVPIGSSDYDEDILKAFLDRIDGLN